MRHDLRHRDDQKRKWAHTTEPADAFTEKQLQAAQIVRDAPWGTSRHLDQLKRECESASGLWVPSVPHAGEVLRAAEELGVCVP